MKHSHHSDSCSHPTPSNITVQFPIVLQVKKYTRLNRAYLLIRAYYIPYLLFSTVIKSFTFLRLLRYTSRTVPFC